MIKIAITCSIGCAADFNIRSYRFTKVNTPYVDGYNTYDICMVYDSLPQAKDLAHVAYIRRRQSKVKSKLSWHRRKPPPCHVCRPLIRSKTATQFVHTTTANTTPSTPLPSYLHTSSLAPESATSSTGTKGQCDPSKPRRLELQGVGRYGPCRATHLAKATRPRATMV